MMNFKSHFKPYIEKLISQKIAFGYKYETAIQILLRFDLFCFEKYPEEAKLTKELIDAWVMCNPIESIETRKKRITPVNHLAILMVNLGVKSATFPINSLPSQKVYQPYIFSSKELKDFFEMTDKCCMNAANPYRHLFMPIFFRLIYSCGLRLSEARNLKIKDVNLNHKILTIVSGKNDKDRLVPINSEMAKRCADYFEAVHLRSNEEDYFFPNKKKQPITSGNAYENFRSFLWQAGISHGGRGKGPRIHDFRHTFAVNRLKKWILEGKNLNALLPVLQAYLGHKSYYETAYYLRLTVDMFPFIIEKAHEKFGSLIPILEEVAHESN